MQIGLKSGANCNIRKVGEIIMEKRFIKIDKAAEMIDCSPWTIRKWIKEGRLKFYRFGGAIRINESDLFAFAAVTPAKKNYLE